MHTASRVLIGAILLLNGGLVAGVVLWQPTRIELLLYLGDFQLIMVLLGFIGSGVILRRAYRQTTIEHVRRQIRLIAMACFSLRFLVPIAFPTRLYLRRGIDRRPLG